MKILGVHDGHTATVALSEDGKILAAISEERINRIKEWQGLPKKAIRRVLQITDTKPEEIDLVVIPYLTKPASREQYTGKNFSLNILSFNLMRKILPRKIMTGNSWIKPAVNLTSSFRNKKEIFSFFETIGIKRKKIIFVDHQTCHAFSTLSNHHNNNDALIITLDGSGDGYCSTINVLEDNEIKNIEKTSVYNSLGFLYARATQFLNMKPLSHEYKVMGLAAYAKEKYYLDVYKKLSQNYIKINSQNPLRLENISGCVMSEYLDRFKKDFKNTRFDNFAGGVQRFTEEIILKLIKNSMEKTGKYDVFLSGGVFMNVKANMRLMYETNLKKLFVFPSCGDESNAIGACNYGYFLLCKKIAEKPKYEKLGGIYFGDEFSDEEIETELKKHKTQLKFSFIKDIDKYVAEQLAKRKIVSRLKGRMEFGARALGNRSILAHPTFTESINKINEYIKKRDFWMPFAGTVLDKDQNKYTINPKKVKAPYMILAFKTKEKNREEIKATIHQNDFTCRPQILEKNFNPDYYALMKHFKKLTGIGAVLNTSFNIHGFPIVRSPRDALNTLLGSGLTDLAIGNFYVEKK